MRTTMSARWTTPAISLLLGLLFLAGSAIGGDPAGGLAMLGVMVVYALLLLAFGGRSETVGILTGRPADERLAAFSLHATAAAGVAALLVALGGFLWSMARGESGDDFALVAASGGVVYLGTLLWLRWRG
jgi:hypothetical protein